MAVKYVLCSTLVVAAQCSGACSSSESKDALTLVQKHAAALRADAADSGQCNWQCYLDRYQDLQNAFGPTNTGAAATHWSSHGQGEGRDCTCADCNWQCYLDRYPDLQNAFGKYNHGAASDHWTSHGKGEGRDCGCDGCGWQCYLDRYQDLQNAFGPTNTGAASSHWTSHGKGEGRDCMCPDESGVCNWQCYLDRYEDLQNAFGKHNHGAAFDHWTIHGKGEGRNCGCDGCDWQCYLDRYGDLQNAFGPTNTGAASTHWTNHGIGEQRDCECPAEPGVTYGKWTITRSHPRWEKEITEMVCGKSTDTFEIKGMANAWCEAKHGTTGQVVVNQDGEARTRGWFCSNQGDTVIHGTPTYVEDSACADEHD